MSSLAVIMSVYRSDRLNELKLAFDSLFEQTYKAMIFLCKDGELSDEVNAYLHTLLDRDDVVILENENNIGLAKSLNRLIDLIQSDYKFEFIARMDADDICRVERFELQINHFRHNEDIDLCGGFCSEFGASFAISPKKLPLNHLELLDFSIGRCPLIHPTVMFRAKIFDDCSIRYPENTTLTEDMALWFELLSKGYRFSNIPYILLDYRLNENTISRRQGLRKAISEFKLRI
ncbi:TPA: glycosyltransferase, partial [Vibrio parahaemolyticus]